MVCPNCDNVLKPDEQFIIHGFTRNFDGFLVDHVKIYSDPDIKIDKTVCEKPYINHYTRLRFD